jgi:guanidinopropionase
VESARGLDVALYGVPFDLGSTNRNGPRLGPAQIRDMSRVITMDDFEELGRKGTIEAIRETVGDAPMYITIDVDGLDPTCMPGTGAPEPGGIFMRDVQMNLRNLRGLNVVGGDVCEVAPPLDPYGLTALNAANFMFEILCLTAESVARREGRL